jgi:hypothetical protein
MFIFGASDWAYVAAAVSAPLVAGTFGIIIWKLNDVYREVRSPNGASTGSLNYDAWKMGMEMREQVAEMREAQIAARDAALQESRTIRTAHNKLENTINRVVVAQKKHDDRFLHLYNHLELKVEDSGE